MSRSMRKPGTAIRLGWILLVVAAAASLRVAASCRCGEGALDLVLIIDTTGSMHEVIGTVKAQMAKIVEVLSGRFAELRVGVVAYRTSGGPAYVTKSLALTDDREKVNAFLDGLRASGGGGEAVREALDAAIKDQPWTPEGRKVAVLVGDEPPAKGTVEETVGLAMTAADRGVVIHTITMSETAWRYFQFNNPEEYERMRGEGIVGRHPSQTFVLPSFRRVSEATKGSAVPGTDARSIVKWLLALSSGDSALGESADEVMALKVHSPVLRKGGLPVLFARLQYRGAWQTPRDVSRLLRHLEEYLPVERFQVDEGVDVFDKGLSGYPLLYLSGHGEVSLPAGGEERLRGYLVSGGFLWADACCGDEKFIVSVRSLAKDMFPDRVFERVGEGHPLFRAAVEIEKVRYTTAHRTAQYKEGKPEAYLLRLKDGRPAIVLTPHSWGAGWGSYPFGRPCLMHDDDALALSMNLLVYLLEGRWCRM